MKNSILLKINSLILVLCLIISSVSSICLYKIHAYAENNEGNSLEPDNSITIQSNELTLEEDDDWEPDPDYVDPPDPFDYDLTCYSPNQNFGTIYQGDYVEERWFNIVNIGSNPFPLTWDEFDESTAFELQVESESYLDMNVGDIVAFCLYPNTNLPPGNYSAYYVFYSANDIRQHHRVQVTVTMTIKKNEPYITSVEVSPASITIPAGKSYQFSSTVTGGNEFDPSVNWSIAGNSSASTYVDNSGTLTIGQNEKSSSIAVIATSRQNTNYYDSAIVNIQAVDHIVSVSADPAGAGAVAGGGAVRDGGTVRVSASPNNNYSFKGWYEGSNLLSVSPQFDLADIRSDRKLVAKFARTTCYIKTSVNNSDAGTITSSTTIQSGGNVTITAKAKNGYSFKEFVENNKSISTSNSIQLNNVTSDRNITAVFVRNQYKVYVNVTPQDTGTYEGAGTYDKGNKVTIKQRAYDGYEFVGWIINGQYVSYNSEYVINNIENDVNITASFRKREARTYKLVSGIANEGGSIVPSGDFVVQEGGSVTYQIVPQSGYNVKSVTVDGKNIGAVVSYTFNNIGQGHTITAAFEKIPVTPAKQTNSEQKSVAPKKQETTKTTYTEDTANKGALPEQNKVEQKTTDTVEELDGEVYIEDTYVPFDDSISDNVIQEEFNNKNIIAKYGMDDATVRKLINDNGEIALLKEAYEVGNLQVTVNNSFAEFSQETSQGLYFDNPSLLNFETVVSASLSDDEKVSVLSGNPILFNVSITENTATVDTNTKKLMQKKIGYKPLCYFDFFIMKSGNGMSEVINKTGAELMVVLPIPKEYRKNGRTFTILRNHNGTIDVLSDLDNDPDTITFKTDKFSEYSIAYEAININRLVLRVIIILIISLVLALICYINLWIYRSKRRRH